MNDAVRKHVHGLEENGRLVGQMPAPTMHGKDVQTQWQLILITKSLNLVVFAIYCERQHRPSFRTTSFVRLISN